MPLAERQAAARISRVGQTCATRCIRLIVKDTIEPNIIKWQEQRLSASQTVSSANFSDKDLDDLFGGN